jgi:membrane associated rhomboid family serine protease
MFGGFTRFGNTTPVVKNLIYLNVIVYLASWYLDVRFDHLATKYLSLFYFDSPYFQKYQFITYMFMHGGISHLFFNMFALWMFGRVLESVWGGQRFLIYYFVTGIGAAVFHTFVNYLHFSHINAALVAFQNTPSPDLFVSILKQHFSSIIDSSDNVLVANWIKDASNPLFIQTAMNRLTEHYFYIVSIPTVGASGAVFGVLLAFGMLFPNTELMLLFPPIPIKAKWFVLGYGAVELFLAVTQPGSNIAHFAHLGGMLFGFILIKYWNSKRTNFY